MDSHKTDVLIVGDDPSALALAIELGSRAISCIVLERQVQLAGAAVLQVATARTRDHLRRWGIDGRQAAGDVDMGCCRDNRAGKVAAPDVQISRHAFSKLLKAHAQTLPSVQFRSHSRLLGIEQNEHAVRSTVCRPRAGATSIIASRYVVKAADDVMAECYRDRRVCVLGDKHPRDAALATYSLSEAVEDGVDFGWKLGAVLQGWGGAILLDSYQVERRPLKQPVVDAGAGIANAPVPDCTYRASPIVVREHPGPARVVAPGAPAPHFFLLDGSSLHDVFGPEFTLLSTGGWTSADLMMAQDEARTLGLPLTVLRAPAPALAALYGARLALIRPDRRVAWRGDAWPYEGTEMLRLVTGH